MKVLAYKHQDFKLGEALTTQQKEHFFKYGFIQFKNFLSRETVQLFLEELEKIESQWLEEGVKKVNGIPLKFGRDEKGDPIIQRMCFVNQFSSAIGNFLKDPQLRLLIELLAPYEGRIGEDEKDGVIVNHYINQPNSKFTKFAWHTDNPRDLFAGHRILPMLNVGVHLDDCPQSNGGLRVLPGTHQQSAFQVVFGKRIHFDHNPDPREVGMDIDAGDLTVHFGSLWHRVQVSPFTGEKSRRRVMYIPFITGKYLPKNAKSRTPFYHHFARFVQK